MAVDVGAIIDLLSSFGLSPGQIIGLGAELGLSQAEQEELNKFRGEQEFIGTGLARNRQQFGERFVEATRAATEENLSEAMGFFSPTAIGSRFSEFADPFRESIEEAGRTSRTRLSDIESGFRGIESGFADIEGEGRVGVAGLVRGQEERERRLLGLQEGLGEQERRDISRSFASEGQAAQQRLGRLGLAGTSAATSAALGTQTARTESLGRLESRLRDERLGLAERLSGETLGARASELDFNLGLSRDTLGATRERLGVQGDISQFLTDFDLQQAGTFAQLGATGAGLQEAGLVNRAQARVNALAPFDVEESQLQQWEDIWFDRFIREPPAVGRSRQLAGIGG